MNGAGCVGVVLLFRLGLAMTILLACGCNRREPPARAEPKPPTVVVRTVEARDVPVSYEFIGQTEATQRIEVRARVPGFIISREYEEGGKVKVGDVLFRLDPRQIEADLEVARAEMDEARAELVASESDVARFAELLAADAGSKKEYDDAVARQTAAVARIRAAEARIARWEVELGYTVARSPITGIAGASKKDVGAFVDGGADSLLVEVIATDPIDVLFTVSEREIVRSRRAIDERRLFLPADGKVTLELTLLDGSVYEHTGAVSFADIQVDPLTGSTRIRGEFPNPAGVLRPGQFVRGRLSGYIRAQAIVVPRAAVLQSPSGAFVLIMGADETIDSRPVVLGDWVGTDVVITSGLSAGDRVVVEGVQRVAPGMRATVVAAQRTSSGESVTPTEGR